MTEVEFICSAFERYHVATESVAFQPAILMKGSASKRYPIEQEPIGVADLRGQLPIR
jgi:hypothetical protein